MTRIAFKSLYVSVAALGLTLAGSLSASAQTPSDMKTTDAQCSTLWTEALAGSSGTLSLAKSAPYVSDFKKADVDGDSALSKSEWATACEKGLVRSSSDGAGDGMSGSSEKTSDRTPDDASPSRTPGASKTGAGGTEAGQTENGTSDRTPAKN